MRFPIHERDTTCPASVDTVCAAEDGEIILTPHWASHANAVAERWIRSAREECLGHLLILNERHLRRVLTEYVAHVTRRRPHQGLDQQCPTLVARDPASDSSAGAMSQAASSTTTTVLRRNHQFAHRTGHAHARARLLCVSRHCPPSLYLNCRGRFITVPLRENDQKVPPFMVGMNGRPLEGSAATVLPSPTDTSTMSVYIGVGGVDAE
jgi:hypothetical protein